MTILIDQIKLRKIESTIVASKALDASELILELNSGVYSGNLIIGTGLGAGTHIRIGGTPDASDILVDNTDGGYLSTDVQLTLETINDAILGNSGALSVSITGNATTSDAWSTTRALTLSGKATGATTIDGTGNIDINVTALDALSDIDFNSEGLMYTNGEGVYSSKVSSLKGLDLISKDPDAYKLMLSTLTGYDPVTIEIDTVGGEVTDNPTYEIIEGVVTEVAYTINSEVYKPVEVAVGSLPYLTITTEVDKQTLSIDVDALPTSETSLIKGKTLSSDPLEDGDIMVYRSATDIWELEAKPTGGGNPTMADIVDYTPNLLTTGNVIYYNGSIYTNINISSLESDPTVPSHVKGITTGNITNWQAAYTHIISAHAPSNADNTAANQTSHADVVVDGDFTQDGFLKRLGEGNYVVDTNTYLTGTALADHTNNTSIHYSQDSITTVGIITIGTWNGTALLANYVPSHDALNGVSANEHIDWTVDTLGTKIHTNNIDAIPDNNAVHLNGSNEISGLTEKTSLASEDILIIEDSASAFSKKKVKASNLPGAGGGISAAYSGVTDGVDSISADGSDTIKILTTGSLLNVTIVNNDATHGDYIDFSLSSEVATHAWVDVGYETKNANIQSHIGSIANPHNTSKSQIGLGSVPNLDTTTAVAQSHSHVNKALLDTYSQTNVDIIDAVSKKHEHTNKAILDTYDQTNANITDAISKKHTQNTDTSLDLGGVNPVSAATIVSHINNVTNPHSVSKTDIGLANVPNLDTTTAVANQHVHGNKALLDSYTQTNANIADAISKSHIHNNLSQLETLTVDMIAAIAAGSLPTALNAFVTQSELAGLGGGDMLKSVYDTNNNGIVDLAENSNLVNNLTVLTAVPAGALFTDTVYTHPNYTETDLNTSGAQVIDVISIADGHIVNAITTRNLTPADIGAATSSHTHSYDNYYKWDIYNNNVYKGAVTSQRDVNFENGTNINVSYNTDAQEHNIRFDHASNSFSMAALTAASVISDINVDSTGHIATVATRNITLANLGYTGDNNANNYIHPTYDSDDINVNTLAQTGATIVSRVTFNVSTDSSGHVTDANGVVQTRELTPSDIGAAISTHSHTSIPNDLVVTGALTVHGTGGDTGKGLVLSPNDTSIWGKTSDGTNSRIFFIGVDDNTYFQYNTGQAFVIREGGTTRLRVLAGGTVDVPGKFSAASVTLGAWKLVDSGSNLLFQYNGVTKATMSSDGDMTFRQ